MYSLAKQWMGNVLRYIHSQVTLVHFNSDEEHMRFGAHIAHVRTENGEEEEGSFRLNLSGIPQLR